jgi:cytochrome b561
MSSLQISRYSKGAIALHWIVGLLIVANFILAQIAEGVPEAEQGAYMNPHKAIGISILAFSVFRLLWRWRHTPPPPAENLKSWERTLSKAVHYLFYFLMIAVPVTGWLMVAAYPGAPAVDFFGLFSIDLPLAESKMLAGIGHESHEILTKVLFFAVLLHILGALKHQFADRMPFIQRMWPS